MPTRRLEVMDNAREVILVLHKMRICFYTMGWMSYPTIMGLSLEGVNVSPMFPFSNDLADTLSFSSVYSLTHQISPPSPALAANMNLSSGSTTSSPMGCGRDQVTRRVKVGSGDSD